jgi:glycogen synthase kinase 3 beta
MPAAMHAKMIARPTDTDYDVLVQVFRKADPNAIDLISRLLEYTPTQRLSAIDAMVHPFFDELRDPNTRLPDSRHATGSSKDLPVLFDFSHHGQPPCRRRSEM